MTKSKILWMASILLLFSKVYAQEQDQRLTREEFFAAVQLCAEESSITLNEGERPTLEQRTVIDACLKEKGIETPQRKKARCNQENQSQ